MSNLSGRCRRCLRYLEENNGKCSYCGKIVDEEDKIEPFELNPGQKLNGRYLVGKSVRKNEQYISYNAYDEHLDSYVQIKEFMPNNLAKREGKQVVIKLGQEKEYENYKVHFCELYQRLKKFRTMSNIEQVYEIFQENNTCYIVTDQRKGMTLSEYLSDNYGELSWEDASGMFTNLMKSITYLHNKGIFHLRISPHTILVTDEKKLRLVDFTSLNYNTNGEPKEIELSEGYSAIEQYGNEKRGAYTDVYGLAATVYKTLTGTMPIASNTRDKKDNLIAPDVLNEDIPKSVSLAIMSALTVSPKLRTHTMDDFYADTITPPRHTQKMIIHKINQEEEDKNIIKSEPKTRKVILLSLLGSLGIVLLAVIIIMLIIFREHIF